MIDKTSPTPPQDPKKHEVPAHITKHVVGPDVKVPESYQKAGFTENDYKQYLNNLLKTIGQEMDKITNKAIQALKEQRQKIESGED